MELVGQTGYTVINAADEAAMGAGTGAVAGALLAGSPTLGLGAAPGAISGAVAGVGIGLKAGTEFGAQMQGVNGLGKEQIAARLKDTALSSALGFLFLNIPGAVYGAHAANLPGKYAAGTGGGEGELSTQNVTQGAGERANLVRKMLPRARGRGRT